MKGYVLLILMLPASLCRLDAQRNVTHQQLLWYGYFNTLRFNDKWTLQSDIQERHFRNPVVQHQFLIRSVFRRTLGNGWDAGIGAAFFRNSPNNPQSTTPVVPEIRPFVEANLKQRFNKVGLDHRYKAEFRFNRPVITGQQALEDEFSFETLRFRYRIQVTVPVLKLSEKKEVKLKVSDEVFVHMGPDIDKTLFDQNRFYTGLAADITPQLAVEAGYLNLFQFQRSGDGFYNRDIIRCSVHHLITVQKPKDQ